MGQKSQQPKTLQDAIQYFSDEQVAIDAVAALRWPDGKPTCPACRNQDHYYLKTQKRWKCKECGKQFSVKVGSIFEDSPIPLDQMAPRSVDAGRTARTESVRMSWPGACHGVSQKAAWFMLHRLRLAVQENFGRRRLEAVPVPK